MPSTERSEPREYQKIILQTIMLPPPACIVQAMVAGCLLSEGLRCYAKTQQRLQNCNLGDTVGRPLVHLGGQLLIGSMSFRRSPLSSMARRALYFPRCVFWTVIFLACMEVRAIALPRQRKGGYIGSEEGDREQLHVVLDRPKVFE
ncbi:hypothetical protein TNCV_3432101 [Trichonephila clavipes]|nr:hypothetical protein TNCV_3432101 [Trichonephila clavipes]